MVYLSHIVILFLSIFSVSVYTVSLNIGQKKNCVYKKKYFGCIFFQRFNNCFCTSRRACSNPFEFSSEKECLADMKKLKGACKRHPCMNKGKCTSLKSYSKYRCNCIGTKYYGKRCHKACPRPTDISLDWLQEYASRKYWQDTPLACIMNST